MNLAEIQQRRKWLVKRARYMRANPTDAERKLWYLLKHKRLMELRWRRQEIVDDLYIVDFICFQYRLIIEADGSQHSDNKSDEIRDTYLKAQDFTVLRFWNSDILTNIQGVGEAVLAAIGNIAAQTRGDPTPQPLSRKGRGALESASHV
jgi:very-short-patch-repair endonuclease